MKLLLVLCAPSKVRVVFVKVPGSSEHAEAHQTMNDLSHVVYVAIA
eukprot:COSAG02_NODE_55370_length_291_cov_0.479167_1_plen_46_part_00